MTLNSFLWDPTDPPKSGKALIDEINAYCDTLDEEGRGLIYSMLGAMKQDEVVVVNNIPLKCLEVDDDGYRCLRPLEH